MAYELGAIYDKKVKPVEYGYKENGEDVNKEFSVQVNTENCKLFLAKKAKNVTIFVSGDDFDTIHKSVDKIVNSIDGVKLIKMSGKGHFTRTSLGTEAFPELLEEVLA